MSRIEKERKYIIAPGETIIDLLEVNNMTQLDLAAKTGINKKTINEIIKGKAPITPATALKLEYVFHIKASFWNNLEINYQEAIEKEKDLKSIESDIKHLDKIPYLEMSKRHWDYIRKTTDSYEKVINLRKFLSVASLELSSELKNKIAYRKSNNEHFSFDALYCYLRYGEIKVSQDEYPKFSLKTLKEKIIDIRALTNKPLLDVLEQVKAILKECGVALVYEKALPKTYVNGVSYKITCDKALIMLSDKGKKDDILWFTLFHEIAHLIKHSQKEVFIDLEDDVSNDIEKEAGEFASNILIPNNIYKTFINKNKKFTEEIIKQFAKENNLTTGIVVGRLQKDHIIAWNQFNNLITRI